MFDESLVLVAICGFLGTIVTTVGAAYLNQRGMRIAASDAVKAQIATSIAARDAANAARLLVEAAKATDSRLETLQKSAADNLDITNGIHTIVNSQRTAMEEKIEAMQKTIDGLIRKLEQK
jgi:hypothetical protein